MTRKLPNQPKLKQLLFFAVFVLFASFSYGQDPVPECLDAAPFCSQEGLIFENDSSGTPAPSGIDYECLFTQPNPAWFFLQIDQSGDLEFEIVQNTEFDTNGNPIGTPLDVDFIAWGPFTDTTTGCSNLNPSTSVDCSYSIAAVENFTISNAVNGEIYILLITNFNGNPGFISLQQTNLGATGAGNTDCDIVFDCSVTIDGGDQTFCGVDDATLTTSTTGPVESYEWFRDDVLIADENSDTLVVTETGTYKVVVNGTECDSPAEDVATIIFEDEPCVTPLCSSIDFEEDFGTGTGRVCDLDGATTTYTCNDATQVEDGQYTITNTSDGLNSGWHIGMEDHTEGDVDGRALYVNADFAAGEFYRRTITLTENADFSFNAWITTVYDTDTSICGGASIPSNVTFRIEDLSGNLIQETSTGDIPNGSEPNWIEYTVGFNTGANTDIQLVLINNSIGGCGNDLAIDDITLTREGATPDITIPPDLSSCDENGNQTASFDLSIQTPIILDGLDPADYNITYHISFNNAEFDTNPISNLTSFVNDADPDTIFVRVERIDEETCFSIVDFDLVILDEIDVTTDLPASLDVCASFSPLDATPTNAGIDLTSVTYQWTDEDGNVLSTEATYSPVAIGLLSVTVNVPPCTSQTFTVDVIAATEITVDLGADFKTCPNEPQTITATTNEPDATFQWFLNGDEIAGETGSTLDIVVSPDAMGTQTYSVIATSGLCTGTDDIDVLLYDVGNCVISQGLSPNGDGFNDSLDLEFLSDRSGVESVQIYNRLGTLVYERAPYVNEWTGRTTDGEELPTGTYFYVINMTTEDPVYGMQATGWIYLNKEAN